MPSIKVSAKTLAHISSGLYRSTAGALKELVNNAFDADATKVSLTLNPPAFDVITCSDNGTGMLQESFDKLMEGGIGYSDKRRTETSKSVYGRPIVGRLGIGLLAMSQIAHSFQVISHHAGTKTAFEAQITIKDYLPTHVDEEAKVGTGAEIGTYETKSIPYDRDMKGVSISSRDLRTGLITRFRQADKKVLPMKFDSFLNEIQASQAIARLGPYWELVWGLCLYPPLAYPTHGPIAGSPVVKNIQDQLQRYSFEFTIDGMQARRPLRFPGSNPTVRNVEHFVEPISFSGQIEGQKLTMEGYLYVQEGKSIVPVEYRGILIRIRNVAVGNYDRSFLDYEIAEGPRFGWISGEVLITEGLEDALNVDRDSLNVAHPHYIKVREVVHTHLQKAFRRLYRGIDSRSTAKEERVALERETRFLDEIAISIGSMLKFKRTRFKNKHVPARLDTSSGTIHFNEDWEWPKKADRRMFLEQLVAAWELAANEKTEELRRDRFLDLTKRLLRTFGRW